MNIHWVHLGEHSVGVMYFGNSPDIRHSPICERTAPRIKISSKPLQIIRMCLIKSLGDRRRDRRKQIMDIASLHFYTRHISLWSTASLKQKCHLHAVTIPSSNSSATRPSLETWHTTITTLNQLLSPDSLRQSSRKQHVSRRMEDTCSLPHPRKHRRFQGALRR